MRRWLHHTGNRLLLALLLLALLADVALYQAKVGWRW